MIRKRTSTFKPRLDQLEDRSCPSIANPALAFVGPGKGAVGTDLYLTTADGLSTQRLTATTFKSDSPSWSPDGTQIAFLRHPDPNQGSADLYTIRPDGSGLRLVRDFSSTPGQPYPSDGIPVTQQTDLAWSPDGRKIVYASWHVEDLWVLDVATGVAQPLIGDMLDYTADPSWSPDFDAATPGYQGLIAFGGIVKGTGVADVFVLNITIDPAGTIQTGQVTNLTNGFHAEWSPDGTSIAYVRRNSDTGRDDLRVMSVQVAGTGLSMTVQVTSDRLVVGNVRDEPSWSPDSQYLAFTNIRQINVWKVTYDLFRIRADGTGLSNVTNTDNVREAYSDWNPKWVSNALTASAIGSGDAQTLRAGRAQPLLAEALARWQAAGVSTSALPGIDVRIADLGGATLGLASGHTIWLDDNAAGWGWFVDATPRDDSEFTTPGDQGEQNRMDLLTVLEHEVGHLLGKEHAASGVMAQTLTPGKRLAPLADATDWLAAVDVAFSKKSSSQWRWW